MTNYCDRHRFFCHDRSYFSRLTRERRRSTNRLHTISDEYDMLPNDNEDAQSQEDEDNDDFDSAVADAEAYELLDDAIHLLDDKLLQQQSNQFY